MGILCCKNASKDCRVIPWTSSLRSSKTTPSASPCTGTDAAPSRSCSNTRPLGSRGRSSPNCCATWRSWSAIRTATTSCAKCCTMGRRGSSGRSSEPLPPAAFWTLRTTNPRVWCSRHACTWPPTGSMRPSWRARGRCWSPRSRGARARARAPGCTALRCTSSATTSSSGSWTARAARSSRPCAAPSSNGSRSSRTPTGADASWRS
mmetsp:Transcript_24193/g.72685  ORF Transcript_24193/g.72685 Transcript_24193/m.72685 type:complete len:206 (+) Transcript_24193:262-879(+)